MKVTTCKITCFACPVQIEGHLEDGRMYYYRCRHGAWRLDVSEKAIPELGFNAPMKTILNGDEDPLLTDAEQAIEAMQVFMEVPDSVRTHITASFKIFLDSFKK